MRFSSRKTINLVAATAAFLAGLLLDLDRTAYPAGIRSAEARIGRPLTPMSYAGVARRTTRRAIYGTAAVTAGAAAAGAYMASPGCAQVTDAYGRVYTKC